MGFQSFSLSHFKPFIIQFKMTPFMQAYHGLIFLCNISLKTNTIHYHVAWYISLLI